MKKKCRVLEIQKNRDINVAAFKQVLEKKCEALVLRTQLQIENQDFSNVLSNLDSIAQHVIRHKNLSIYPLSYAVIHEKKATEESNELLKKFFKESVKANESYDQILGEDIPKTIQLLLNKLCNQKISLLTMGNAEFPKYNIRQMIPANDYAIEIHCENSFLSQLNTSLRAFLYKEVDIENALSFYVVLQKDHNGDLLLFDKEWDQFTIEAGLLDESIRKNKDLFFSKTNYNEFTRVELNVGDMVIFRAAQIWHCIDEVEGVKSRVTLGGFIAPSLKNPEQFYYWS
jgi:hypothetical protein